MNTPCKANGGAAGLKVGFSDFQPLRTKVGLPVPVSCQAISAPYPHLTFYPTGGVTEKNLQE